MLSIQISDALKTKQSLVQGHSENSHFNFPVRQNA